jgi:hypothetical protein
VIRKHVLRQKAQTLPARTGTIFAMVYKVIQLPLGGSSRNE